MMNSDGTVDGRDLDPWNGQGGWTVFGGFGGVRNEVVCGRL